MSTTRAASKRQPTADVARASTKPTGNAGSKCRLRANEGVPLLRAIQLSCRAEELEARDGETATAAAAAHRTDPKLVTNRPARPAISPDHTARCPEWFSAWTYRKVSIAAVVFYILLSSFMNGFLFDRNPVTCRRMSWPSASYKATVQGGDIPDNKTQWTHIPLTMVLNLERRDDRRKTMEDRLDSAFSARSREKVEILVAVDATDPATRRAAIRDHGEWYLAAVGQLPSRFGCHASHVKAWRRLVEQARGGGGAPFALILEDDAEFQPGFEAAVTRAVTEAPSGWDYVTMSVRDTGFWENIFHNILAVFVFPMNGICAGPKLWGLKANLAEVNVFAETHAQLVSVSGARKLLAMLSRTRLATDFDLAYLSQTSQINVLALLGAVKGQDSSVGDNHVENVALSQLAGTVKLLTQTTHIGGLSFGALLQINSMLIAMAGVACYIRGPRCGTLLATIAIGFVLHPAAMQFWPDIMKWAGRQGECAFEL